ncbi:SUKH-4 family immunity protein [Streptomyces fulvoviolaceus]|uniref:SUKH-4 family immunity protein n=1 Tax=Streptomyces fulvoviolaceus TaxID=285535 RepID=UPI0004CAAEDC|nr:SUKH-4 family immunity protein [Streptomyces fulvoviolaceus]MCT9078363.1 SUKH-4 family immunity protein [Streptomyces fulvoviolaceus]
MATQQQLIDLFGAGSITCLDLSDREVFKSAGIEAEELFEVGLPDRLAGMFSAEVVADPETFDGVSASIGGSQVTLVTLGAPHSESDLRYYLNPLDGRILLARLVAENPEIEVVNESLGNFIEFLYRIGRYKAFSMEADENQQADYKDLLTAYLTTLDPGSLKESDNWWSMVIRQL